jgi:hypothetical protein
MGTGLEQEQSVADPLLYAHPLPLVRVFYPFGHAVELSTDSSDIVAAASAIWARYPRLSGRPALRLRVAVSSRDAEVPPVAAMPRGQEHLVTIVHGSGNFAVADLAGCFAFACLTRDVARDHAYCVYHFLEPLAYLLLSAGSLTMLHAACIAREGKAILLAGDSGAGKTCLAYACARKGWTFLSGDATQFERGEQQGAVIGRPFSIRFRESARELFPELRAYAVSPHLNGKLDIEPPVDELPVTTALQACASHIVFLSRSQTARPPSLLPMMRTEAFRRLEQVFFFGDGRLRREQRAGLEQFTRSLPALEMTYSDLDEAEKTLRSLLA